MFCRPPPMSPQYRIDSSPSPTVQVIISVHQNTIPSVAVNVTASVSQLSAAAVNVTESVHLLSTTPSMSSPLKSSRPYIISPPLPVSMSPLHRNHDSKIFKICSAGSQNRYTLVRARLRLKENHPKSLALSLQSLHVYMSIFIMDMSELNISKNSKDSHHELSERFFD